MKTNDIKFVLMKSFMKNLKGFSECDVIKITKSDLVYELK